MTREEFKKLERGDIIRNENSHESYVVASTYGDYVIGVRTVHACNPSEWIHIKKQQ